MHKPFAWSQRSRTLLISTLSAAVLGLGAVALAAIISGTATTAHSSQVTVTQIDVNRPSLSNGDLMLAAITVNGGSQAVVTAPTGWQEIARTDNDVSVTLITYWKVAASGDPSTFRWTVDGQTTAEGSIIPLSGVNTTTPVDASSGNSGFATTATTSSITTTASNDEVIALFATDVGKSVNAGAYFSTASGMTEKFDVTNTPFGPSMAADDAIKTSAGSTGSISSTISGGKARNWVTQIIALRPPASLTTNIVHYWKLDESSGNAVDAVGGLTLTNINSAPFETGILGNAPHLNGSTQTFGTTTDLLASAPTAYTFCSWINVDNSDPGNGYNFFISYDNPLAFRMTYISIGGTPQLRFIHVDSNGDSPVLDYNVTLSPGAWHHVCGTWNDPDLTLYFDGSSVATQTASGAYAAATLGTYLGSSDPSGTDYFDGKIDEVGVWTRALSASEITQLYNGGAGLQYPF